MKQYNVILKWFVFNLKILLASLRRKNKQKKAGFYTDKKASFLYRFTVNMFRNSILFTQ